MKRNLRYGPKRKQKLSSRLILVAGSVGLVVILTTGWLVYLNFQNLSKTQARNGSDNGGAQLSQGDIVAEFTWEKDPVTLATLGPDAISSSKEAHSAPGGRSSTQGLAPGQGGQDINLEIQGSEIFNLDGIDISMDYRRTEPTGYFFSRGNYFSFGMEEGYITVKYKTGNGRGGYNMVKEKTEYEIPVDPLFRTYRFIYTPSSGRAEIFVNNAIVWSHQGEKNRPLAWKGTDNIIIGKEMNGGGIDRPVFDNLIIRSTGSAAPLAESLLNFMLEVKEGHAVVHWSSSANKDIDYFSVERSVNGNDFCNAGRVKANPNMAPGDEYTFTDRTEATSPLVYYRLRQYMADGKFITHPLAAVKFNQEKELSIDRVSPQFFNESLDIAYYIPKPGRVWMQVSDNEGKIVTTQTFEGSKGKNVHVFTDKKGLSKGEYILSIIFENKKVSAKVTKI
ncbi:MAG: hypothetical protein IT242_03685 [Bacteroidia bacterium]|nr:hypothetical protein [Bacteroidia bacterium]